MQYKLGDLVTFRVLEVQRAKMRVRFMDTKQDFWIVSPAEPLKPPFPREWAERERWIRRLPASLR